MFSGHNFIGFDSSAQSSKRIKVFSTSQQDFLHDEFAVASNEEVEAAVKKAKVAFETYKKTTPEAKAVFLETIAEAIMNIGDDLIRRAMVETGLPEARLIGERGRTIGQLRMFAALLREGSWVEAVIDPAQPDRIPLPRADLRRMLLPIGPVVVFGASNFPFAFSTAGGDTTSALAAGCPVIVKAHASHLGTNELVTKAIIQAARNCGMPDGVFSSLIDEGITVGQALARHPEVKAIGFTGSYKAGMALYRTATHERQTPIPVFAEMSSINPVLILPGKLEKDSDKMAEQLAASMVLGGGQFCTNPGLLFVLKNDSTETFLVKLTGHLQATSEATMLNQAICKNYYSGREKIAQQKGVRVLHSGADTSSSFKGSAALMEVDVADFTTNPGLQDEVFGPASLIVTCNDATELQAALQSLHGQLTGTVYATREDLSSFEGCIESLKDKVGRIIFNNVPTGVEVCHAMVHGGPFPATTDARTTSVGADAIKRFVRPVCFQDCPEAFLPDALKNENPLGIMRKWDGQYTRAGFAEKTEA